MEITLLRRPEEVLIPIVKGEFLENLGFEVDVDKVSFTIFGIRMQGVLKKKVEDENAVIVISNKLGGIKLDIKIIQLDEYSSRLKMDIHDWGLIGPLLKSKVRNNLINFVIKAEFESNVRVERKLRIKLYTNYLGLLKLFDTLLKESERNSYYVLIINKGEYVVEIVGDILLSMEEIKNACEKLCYIEIYELKPISI